MGVSAPCTPGEVMQEQWLIGTREEAQRGLSTLAWHCPGPELLRDSPLLPRTRLSAAQSTLAPLFCQRWLASSWGLLPCVLLSCPTSVSAQPPLSSSYPGPAEPGSILSQPRSSSALRWATWESCESLQPCSPEPPSSSLTLTNGTSYLTSLAKFS